LGNPPITQCYKDTVHPIANSLQLILRFEKDYKDINTFISSLLQIKFVESPGKIFFDLDWYVTKDKPRNQKKINKDHFI